MGEGEILVGKRLAEVAVGLPEEFVGLLAVYLSGEGDGIHKHAEGIGAAHVPAAVGHGAQVHLLLPAEAAYRDKCCSQEVAGRGNTQRVAARHNIGPYFFPQPDFMTNLVLLRLIVGDQAGFLLLAFQLGREEGFGFLVVVAVLVGFLVLGVLEIGVGFLFGGSPLQGAGELLQKYVIGAAVKDEVMEVGQQTQLAGRLHNLQAV